MGQRATCGSVCQRPPTGSGELPPDDPKLQVFALESPGPSLHALRLADGGQLSEEAPEASSRSQSRSGTRSASPPPDEDFGTEAAVSLGLCSCGCLVTPQIETRPVVIRATPVAGDERAEDFWPVAAAGAGAGPQTRKAPQSEEPANHRPTSRRRPSVPPIETAQPAPEDEEESSQPLSAQRQSRRTSTGNLSYHSVRVSTGAHSVKASQHEVREDEHQRAVAAWLAANGFRGGVRERRRRLTGSTYPLHVAADQGLVRMVGLLLRAAADPDDRNGRGLTALDVAQRATRRHSAAAAEILEALEAAARASRREPCAPYASESLAERGAAGEQGT